MESKKLDWKLKLEEQIKKMDACNVVTSIGKKRIATSFINKGNYFVSTVKISNKQWREIVNLADKIKLKELSSLKAPSEKRKFDGAAHAQLKVFYKK